MLIGISVVRRGDGRFAIIALGHTVFAADRLEPMQCPGLIILGAQELKLAPRIWCGAADGQRFKYADLAMLPGGADLVFVMVVMGVIDRVSVR
jgi:hypothetical protein